MKYYLQYTENGKIVFGSWDTEVPIAEPNLIIKTLETRPEGNLSDWYVDNDQLIAIPPKPDYQCSFDYDTKQWVGDTSKQEISIISQRNAKLYSSDWTQIPNNPLTPEVQQQWADYRQQLRDITNQSGYPFNVVWPTQPE